MTTHKSLLTRFIGSPLHLALILDQNLKNNQTTWDAPQHDGVPVWRAQRCDLGREAAPRAQWRQQAAAGQRGGEGGVAGAELPGR